MYGLPDSMVVGTARRVSRVGRRKPKYKDPLDLTWALGLLILGAVWLVARIIVEIAYLF